ncbi:glycosyltransferase [Spirochaetota bacterium]
MKKKILHILDHSVPQLDGYSFRSQYILQNQRKHGFHVIVLTSPKHKHPKENEEIIDNIKYYRIINSKYNKGIWGIPFLKEWKQISIMYKRIIEILSTEKVDIIHAHSPSLNGLAARKAAKKLGIPLVYEVRAFWEDAAVDQGTFKKGSLKYTISRYIETDLYKKADRLITICESMKKEIISRGIPEIKISVVPNGVDIDRFQPLKPDSNLIDKYNLKGKMVLGFIGSFFYFEGIDQLVTLMLNIIPLNNNVVLMLVGGGG